MMLNEEERNEFYRAKHAKSIKAALYELGNSTLYLADQAAEIWPQYKEPAFMVAVAMLFCDDRLGTTQLEINGHLRKGPQ